LNKYKVIIYQKQKERIIINILIIIIFHIVPPVEISKHTVIEWIQPLLWLLGTGLYNNNNNKD